MGGPRQKAFPEWLSAVAELFGMPVADLSSLQHVLDDESCWFTASDLPCMVIPLMVPNPDQTSGYLSLADASTIIPRHRHAARETVLVLRGHLVEEGGVGRDVRTGERLVSEPGTAHATRMLDRTVVASASTSSASRSKLRGTAVSVRHESQRNWSINVEEASSARFAASARSCSL